MKWGTGKVNPRLQREKLSAFVSAAKNSMLGEKVKHVASDDQKGSLKV